VPPSPDRAGRYRWPYRHLEARTGAQPAGVADGWFSNQGITLRCNRPSLVRLTASEASAWPQDVVATAEPQGWAVLHAATTVAFYTPDGQVPITADDHKPPIVRGLARLHLPGWLRTRDSGFVRVREVSPCPARSVPRSPPRSGCQAVIEARTGRTIALVVATRTGPRAPWRRGGEGRPELRRECHCEKAYLFLESLKFRLCGVRLALELGSTERRGREQRGRCSRG
jgi:hypothetical protein